MSEPATHHPNERGLLILVFGQQVLNVVDVMVMLIGAPRVSKELGASPGELQLVFGAYAVAIAVTLVLGGMLGDRFGRDRMMRIGVLMTMGAAIVSACTPNMALLIGCRAVAGLASAAVTPQVIGLMQTIIPIEKRPHAFSIWGFGGAAGTIVGHLGGGLLLRVNVLGLEWRAGFVAIAVLGAVLFVMIVRIVPRSERNASHSFDVRGIALLALGLSTLVYPLAMGRTEHWPAWMFVMLGVAAVSLVAFARHEWRLANNSGEPLFDLRLLRITTFRAGLLSGFAKFCSTNTFLFLFTVFVQVGLGIDPLTAGALMSVNAVGFIVATNVAKRYTGLRTALVGCVIGVVGYALFAVEVFAKGGDTSIPYIVPAVILTGVAQGAAIPQILRYAMHDVAPEQSARAGAAVTTSQQVSGGIGVALIGTIFFWRLGDRTDSDGYATAFAQTMLVALVPIQVAAFGFVWRLRRAVAAQGALVERPRVLVEPSAVDLA